MKSIYIEITNVCNLHCSFCPCRTTSCTERDLMPTPLFEKCIEEALNVNAETVYFHVLGEPTLHPAFGIYLKKLEGTPLKLTLTTNGTTIARNANKILSSPAVRQINFSTHAYAELDRSEAETHLQNVIDFCKLALAARPDLYINLRLWNVGAQEASPWNNYMLRCINDSFGTNVSPGNFCSRHKSFNITGRLYLHEDTRFDWPGAKRGNSEASAFPRGTCRALDSHVAILHDGRVVACCLDYEGHITLGHIKNNSLSSILESEFTSNIKEGFNRHELRHPFCQNCTFCKRFK